MKQFVLISFATEKYYAQQERLVQSANQINEFNKIISFREIDIDSTFYNKNKHILSQPRGAGFWLWKPYFLLKTMDAFKENDIILYLDCHHIIHNKYLAFILKNIFHDCFFVMSENLQKEWTKRDCFVEMNCDNEHFYNSTQLEAGICAFRKSMSSVGFLKLWLQYCENENILTDKPNVCGLDNLKEFIDHRHDQSILTNLYHKYALSSVWSAINANYIGEGR